MTKRKPKSPLEHEVRDVDLPVGSLNRVANLALVPRLLGALRRIGQFEGTREAAVAAFDAHAVRCRKVSSAFQPTVSQQSSVRRALARLQRAGLIVGAGRRRRLKIYRTAADGDRLMELSLGTIE